MGKKIDRRIAFKLTMSILMVGMVSIVGALATCDDCQATNTSYKSQIFGFNNIGTTTVPALNEPTSNAPTFKFNKQCFSSCMSETWPYLPSWVKSTCGGVCRSCMNGNLWACAGCYGCTLGYTVGCANECL